MIVAFLDHFPERHVRIVAVLRHVQRRHVERKSLELEGLLAAEEGFAPHRIDFRDLLVGHRVAAAGGAIAMHHQFGTGMAERAVIGVGVAGVEGKIIGRLRVHLRGRDRVEAFRRLAVAFARLGPEIARPAADRVGLQQRKLAGAVLLPDLKLGFLLEQADQDRRLQIHVLFHHRGKEFWRNRLIGLGVVGERNLVGVTASQQCTARREHSGSHKCADQRARNQDKAPHPLGNFRDPVIAMP